VGRLRYNRAGRAPYNPVMAGWCDQWGCRQVCRGCCWDGRRGGVAV